MGRKQSRYNTITEYIAKNVRAHPHEISAMAQNEFNISRQAINRYFKLLIKQKMLDFKGNTRSREYIPCIVNQKKLQYEIPMKNAEDIIWRDDFSELMIQSKSNIRKICRYGFTEIVNNALEHSSGSELQVSVQIWFDQTRIIIEDNGVGIFTRIKEEFGYQSVNQIILDLSKGKLTTNADSHTGEGIFFTSRSFDHFQIDSNSYSYFQSKGIFDWVEHKNETISGTRVTMSISNYSPTELENVFDRYLDHEGNFSFSKTNIQVALAQFAEDGLVTRSQATRILSRLEQFQDVELDFENVPWIGQGFADEIFRVYVRNNPQIHVVYKNANEQVEKMIKHAANG